MPATQPTFWDVQRRSDGAVLVRVHSRDRQGGRLPDAVFAFRLGDPQYDYWCRQLADPMARIAAPCSADCRDFCDNEEGTVALGSACSFGENAAGARIAATLIVDFRWRADILIFCCGARAWRYRHHVSPSHLYSPLAALGRYDLSFGVNHAWLLGSGVPGRRLPGRFVRFFRIGGRSDARQCISCRYHARRGRTHVLLRSASHRRAAAVGKGDRLGVGWPALRAVRPGLVSVVQRRLRLDARGDCGRGGYVARARGSTNRPPAHCPAGRYGRTEVARRSGRPELGVDQKAFDAICRRVAAAVRQSLDGFQPVDHIGIGQAKVERVASNRRPVDASGKIAVRFSTCSDPAIRALPEGNIDPYVKTITFARGDKPLVRLHYYATHPQTSYGDGRASSDIVGDAREALEREENVEQIYFTGCSGDVTMGKYNDGSPECRPALAKRLLAGMRAAAAATRFVAAEPIRWRTYALVLPARTDGDFQIDKAVARTKDATAAPVQRVYFGAACVAFDRRIQRPIELASLEIGNVCIVHLPGEPMICFQQFAQTLKPDAFVAVAGYGDGAPGYLCPAKAYKEGGYEPTASRVTPEAAPLVKKAITALLGAD